MHEKNGFPIPDHLFAPDIAEGYELYLNAFWTLNSDRNVGFDLGEIPFLAIDRYAARLGIEDIDEFWLLFKTVRAMSAAYLKRVRTNKK